MLYKIFNRIFKIISRHITRKLKIPKYIEPRTQILVCEYNQASLSKAMKEEMFASKLSNCFRKLAAISFLGKPSILPIPKKLLWIHRVLTIVKLIDMFLMNTFFHLNCEMSNIQSYTDKVISILGLVQQNCLIQKLICALA